MSRRTCVLLLAAAGAAACAPAVSGASGAPPGLVLRHETVPFSDDVIVLSAGVAYALDCFEPWASHGTCDDVVAVSENRAVATVHRAHMERTTDWMGQPRRIPARPGFVLAAMGPGETTLTLTGSGGQTRLRVVVE